MARKLGLQHGHVTPGVDARGGKFVFRARQGVENRARGKSPEVAGPARGLAGHAQVGLIGHELLQPRVRRRRVLADDGDRRLNFRDHAHVAEQFFRPAKILPHRIEQRQAALHVGVDVRLAMLDLLGVDPAGRRSSSRSRFPRRPDRSQRRNWPTDRRRGRQGPQPGPARRTVFGSCRPARETIAKNTRRRGLCGGRSPAAACANG